jgi:hypothetical protein
VYPQQFEERVAEEEAPIGGSLTRMDVACAFREAELAQQFGFGSAHIHANEEMVKFKHITFRGKASKPPRREDAMSVGS